MTQPMTPERARDLLATHGTLTAAASVAGVHRSTFTRWVRREAVPEPRVPARVIAVHNPEPSTSLKPGTHIFTCQQNNTPNHDGFVRNLRAYARARNATIHVSRFTYDKSQGGRNLADREPIWWSEAPGTVHDEPIEVAKGLIWCAELQLLPTAVRPLSGLMTYTRDNSAIIPHVKMALESAPTLAENPRFVMTTGACTLPNYIMCKTGQKAAFHHIIGALVVDVAPDGTWEARHINAEHDGSFQDLRVFARDGKLHDKDVSAFVLGDLHSEQVDKEALRLVIAIMDHLRPADVVLHDVLDFLARNHHRRNDPHENFRLHVSGHSSVTHDIHVAMLTLLLLSGEGRRLHAVQSNHDDAFYKWLREADFRTDPENAELFLRASLTVYEHLRDGNPLPTPLELAMVSAGCEEARNVHFVGENDSLLLEGVECGMHGHHGPNGARGSAQALLGIGKKLVVGHSHTARIVDGVFSVGVTGKLRMGYNNGPSSWSHTHCVIYPNGKRALLTPTKGKWK